MLMPCFRPSLFLLFRQPPREASRSGRTHHGEGSATESRADTIPERRLSLALRNGEVFYEDGLLACVVYDDAEREYQYVELRNGKIARKITLPLDEGEHVDFAVVRRDQTCYLAERNDDELGERFRLCVLNHSDGTVQSSEDFTDRLSPDWMGYIQINDMTVDKSGSVVVMTNGDEVAVCRSDLTVYVLPVPHA